MLLLVDLQDIGGFDSGAPGALTTLQRRGRAAKQRGMRLEWGHHEKILATASM